MNSLPFDISPTFISPHTRNGRHRSSTIHLLPPDETISNTTGEEYFPPRLLLKCFPFSCYHKTPALLAHVVLRTSAPSALSTLVARLAGMILSTGVAGFCLLRPRPLPALTGHLSIGNSRPIVNRWLSLIWFVIGGVI